VDEGSDWISTGEAARRLGLRSVNSVKRLIRTGRLRAIRPGAHFRVSDAEVRQLAASPHVQTGSGSRDPRNVGQGELEAWARRHRVKQVALFGSAARGRLRRASDVDVVVELGPDAGVGLFEHVEMEEELERIFGRPVDLGTWASMKPSVREQAERDAVVLYEAG